jgi:hypothetical protein
MKAAAKAVKEENARVAEIDQHQSNQLVPQRLNLQEQRH